MAERLIIGQRVRIDRAVSRTVWGAPCNWGGIEATVVGGGSLVQGVRIYRVQPDDCETTAEFAAHLLRPTAQAELFQSTST